MRDVWEHFDEYIMGRGRLQSAGQERGGVATAASLGVYVWTVVPGFLGSFQWAGLGVDVDASVAAAHALYGKAAVGAG